MQNPQVSIIVPIFNVQSYLKECLQSICSQSYANLDIILVDDESTDESLNLALEFAKKDERIFVVSKPNGGLSSSRNFGIEMIKGSPLRKALQTQMQNSFSKDEKNTTKENSLLSLTQTHSFNNSTKTLDVNELLTHFTCLGKNYVKSDVSSISKLIIQTLPKDALIHFVDSDDYLDKDCIKFCVDDLSKNKADISFHHIQEFKDENKEFKANKSYLTNCKYNAKSGLDFLAQNKFYDFYFSPQGLFKASLLNSYTLRYTEGIYHEDHDFGTLLFCLANKISHLDKALYFYRQRANSTMTSQNNKTFPKKLPYFLEPLRDDFEDYKELRVYFKAYCFVLVGFSIWRFYTQKSLKDEAFERKYKDFFSKSTLSYMKIFKSPLNPDSLHIKKLLQKISFPKWLVWWDFIKDLHRQPKKIRYIKNIKYLLQKEKQ